jgi:hypothetical protein
LSPKYVCEINGRFAGHLQSVCLSFCISLPVSTTKSGNVYPTSSTTPRQTSLKVESDRRTLHNVAGQLENTRSEFISLHQSGGWIQRGYFVGEENNRIEHLYLLTEFTGWERKTGYGQEARWALNMLVTKIVSREGSNTVLNLLHFLE